MKFWKEAHPPFLFELFWMHVLPSQYATLKNDSSQWYAGNYGSYA